MKLTVVFLLAACLQVSAGGYAQKVTLDMRNVSLEKVLREIRKQSGYLFLYQSEEVRKAGRVSVQVKDAAVEEALRQCLLATPFTFRIVDRTIVLNPREEAPTAAAVAIPAGIPVQGRVTDASGAPLAGATVTVQGSRLSTTTNEGGEFSLKDVAPNAVLEISFVGYQTQIVRVNSQGALQVQLRLADNQLDETVVIAYGKTSRRLNTGSVSSVTSEAIGRQPVADPLGAMQGRVSGLMITSSSGMPGSGFQVRVRGENSMKQGNDPLYIIDGVPFISEPLNQFAGANGSQSPLNSINPNDIERIDVLKDADATAIYGSRGANGVILITTKKGKSGETQVNFDVYSGISQVSRKLDMLNTQQYLQLRKEAFELDGTTPALSNAPDLLEWDQNAYTDWQDLMIGNTAKLTQMQASVSGGTDQTRFFLSSTYRHETTVLPGDMAFRKGGVHLNADHTSKNGRFHAGASVNYTADKNTSIPTDISQYFYLPPNYPVYNPDGSYYWWGNTQNPLAYLHRGYETNTNNLIGNGALSYTLLPGLSIRTNLGYTQTSMKQVLTLPAAGFNPDTYSGSSSQFGFSSVKSYIVEPQAEYTTNLAGGRLNVLAGASWQQSISDGHYLQATGFSSDALLKNMMAATSLTTRNYDYSQYNYQSVFGRVNYNWAQKYLVNLTFRRDGSSRFGPGRQFGNFGSVGGAWVFTNEPFLRATLPFLSYGKLRGSYGTTGNDQIGNYQYLDSWSSSSFPYGGISGLYPTRVFNADYGWELNKKLEGALELGFLKDRILLTAGYYNNRSSNQLVGYTLSPQAGFTSYTANLPAKVQNSGWEFELNTVNVNSDHLKWSSALNLTLPQNKLLAYPGLESSADANSYVVGESIRIVKGFQFTGVNPETGVPEFLDVDKDGKVTEPGDFVVMGETMPQYFGGLSNQLLYKRWSLDVFLQFVKQEGPTMDYGPMVNVYGSMSNTHTDVLDRWMQPGNITSIPRPSASTTSAVYSAFRTFYRYSDAVWGDASYVRLKNVALSYDLSGLTSRWKIRGASIYLQGQNLLTFTNYKGLDPEVSGFDRKFVSAVNPFGSVKPQALPVLRTLTAGLKLTL